MQRSLDWTALLPVLAALFGTAAINPVSAHAQDDVPALAIIAPSGAKSLLIGTLHVPYPGMRQPSMSVLQGAKTLIIESSTMQGPQPEPLPLQETLDPEVFAGRATRASWAMALTDAQIQFLQQRLSCNAPQLGHVDLILKARSPRMAAGIAWTPCGAPGRLSRDAILARAAQRYGVPTLTLETQVDVEHRRRAIPDRIYLHQLMTGLDLATQGNDFAQIVSAFNRGDFATVAALALQDRGYPDDAALFRRVMVHDRNLAWMPALRQALDAGDAVVAVGAAHLPGPDGLIDLLQADGYQIRETTVPNDPALETQTP